MIVLLSVVTACGPEISNPTKSQSTSSPSADDVIAEGPLPRDFLVHPLGEGAIPASSLADAQDQIPFIARDVSHLGPVAIETTDPDKTIPRDGMIAWVFDRDDVGRFVLVESVTIGGLAGQQYLEEPTKHAEGCTTRPFTPEEQLELGPAPGGEVTTCHSGDAEIAEIRNGTRAVLISGENATTLTWLEPLEPHGQELEGSPYDLAVSIQLIGPPDTFTPDEALRIAEKI